MHSHSHVDCPSLASDARDCHRMAESWDHDSWPHSPQATRNRIVHALVSWVCARTP